MRPGLRRHGTVGAALAAVCVVVLWPALSRGRSRLLVGSGDSSVFIWSWWALPNAIRDGGNPFLTSKIFYPIGADLSLTTTAPLIALVTAPVRAIWGPVAQVNAAQLLGTWMAGFAAYLLVHHVTRNRMVAGLGGLAFAFAPFRFVHLPDHLNLVHTGFLPLGVLAFLRLLDRPTRGRSVVLGAVLAGSFLTDPQLTILTLACIAPLAVARRAELRGIWPLLGRATVVGVIGATPLLLPMANAMAHGQGNLVDPASMVVYSADLSRWLVPPGSHRIFGPLARAVLGHPPDEGIAYPGVVILLLAAAAFWVVDGRTRRPWMWMFGVGAILALGPYLSFRGKYAPIPLPFIAFRFVPGLAALRVPGRFAIVGILGLVVLGCLALVELLRRSDGRRRLLLAAVVVVVMTIDLWPRAITSRPAGVPDPYLAIAERHGDGAVLEVPLQWSTGERVIGYADHNVSILMAYAAQHGHPLVSGSVSRYPDDRLAQLLSVPVYRQLLTLQGEPGMHDRPAFGVNDLSSLGIEFVVYHRDLPVQRAFDHLKRLKLPVLADDGTVIVWVVPPSQ